MLRFSILGPLEIHRHGHVLRPRGSLQRTLLLALLVNEGRLVATDALIGELWGERHPSRVENALQAHVSRLRHQLATLEPEAATSRLVTHASGYQLVLDEDELDATVFTRGLERTRSTTENDPSGTVDRLRFLLTLWRGPALGGRQGGPLCLAAATRYEESRLAALELLFECELRNGRHTTIIPELRELLIRHAYQERFWQQLMVALCRSGRRADALSAYRELWQTLANELGLEPSPYVRACERAILDQDPDLDPPTPPGEGNGAGYVLERMVNGAV